MKITCSRRDSKSDVLAKGRTWQEFISNLETENDVEVDSAYKDKYNNFIEFYSDGELFEGEVTKYHGGDYELLQENVRKVQASKVMSTVQGEIDKYFDDDEYTSNFTYIDSKEVTDSNGFITEYTWYKSEDGNNVFVFGDPDMYRPEDGNFDYETENDELAQEWFSSYTGFEDTTREDLMCNSHNYGALDENKIIEWLGDHEQAWEDFTSHFSEYDINQLSDDEIIGWIYDHDLLFEDFSRRFPDIASDWLNTNE